jgi:hypothetical protein
MRQNDRQRGQPISLICMDEQDTDKRRLMQSGLSWLCGRHEANGSAIKNF